MQAHSTTGDPATRPHRPKTLTVFAAAFAAGAVLAYGVDRVVDVHVVQVEPQVESEPIFVALRSLPQGSPLTVWDVALRDWPKAMLPTTALKADASLEGMVLRHPIREGQPLLSIQLVRDGVGIPGVGLAALPSAAAPVATGTTSPAQPVTHASTLPASVPAAEQFVPATPAEVPVATAAPAAIVDLAAAPVDPAPMSEATTVEPGPAVTDADIDPRDPAESAPSLVDSQAVAADDEPTPTLAVTADPPAAEPTTAAPLAAPVPALPTTDIARSLAAVGQGDQATPSVAVSVLSRTEQQPAPQTQSTPPRYHLVVPERVALAADASFAQRPAVTVKPSPAPVQSAPGAARMEPRPNPAAASATRQQRTNPAGRQPTVRQTPPTMRQPAGGKARKATSVSAKPSAKPTGGAPTSKEPAAETQPSRPLGLGAWFPQLSGGNRQR